MTNEMLSEKTHYTDRRDFLKCSLGIVGAEMLAGCCVGGLCAGNRSRFRGIQIGAITYSYRTMPTGERDALEMIRYCRESGIGSVELMGRTVEYHLKTLAGLSDQADPKRVAAWRENFADWGRVRDLRDRFADAGVGVHIVKFGEIGEPYTSDGENDYFCRLAREFGAKAVTRELPKTETWETTGRRLGAIADRNEMQIGFHNHLQITKDTYEGAILGYSPKLMINFDIGHYIAANDDDPLKLVERFRDRIVSVHLKDRTTKAHGQKNLVWGKGDTPLGPLFAQMIREGYDFNADVELEYEIPADSDAVKEVARCVSYSESTIAKSPCA